MNRKLFNAQLAQYSTPRITGENSVNCSDGIKCYLPGLEIRGNTGQGILPVKYQQVEYIESTGTQYILTEFTPNQDTRVVADFQLTSVASSFIFGARYAQSRAFTLNIASGTKLVAARGTSGNKTIMTADTKRHIVDYNKSVISVDDTSYTFADFTFTTPKPLTLFACADTYAGNDGYLPSKMKLYSCKIYDNDVLVRDYVPCYRISDNAIGLYDLVDDRFYVNSGTDSFVQGTDYAPPPTIDNPQTIYNVNATEFSANYQQLTYIESTGTQYIDSGFVPNQDTKVYCKFQLTKIGGNYPFGVRETSQKNICYVSGGASVWNFRFGKTSGLAYGATDTELHEIEMSKEGIIWDGISLDEEIDQTEFTAPGNFYVFALNNNGSVAEGKTKIYNLKLYDNGTLIRDYIPCCRKIDGQTGLYDLVTETFCVNDGEGEFEKGENYVLSYSSAQVSGKNLIDVDKFTELILSYDTTVGSLVEVDGRRCIRFMNGKMHNKDFTSCFPALKENKRYIFSYETKPYTIMPEDNQYGGSLMLAYKGMTSTQLTGVRSLSAKTTTEFTRMYVVNNQYTTVTDIAISYGSVHQWLIDLDTVYLYEYEEDDNPAYEPYYEPQVVNIPDQVILADGTILPLLMGEGDTLVVDSVKNKVAYVEKGLQEDISNSAFADRTSDINSLTEGRMWFQVTLQCNCVAGKGYCNIVGNTDSSYGDYDHLRVTQYQEKTLLGIITTGFNSLEEFNEWKATNPIIVRLERVEPIEYDITNTEVGQQLLSLIQHKNTTIIEVSNEHGFVQSIVAKYLTHA